MNTLSGPMFESKESDCFKSIFGKEGAHYNLYSTAPGKGMEALKQIFPDAKADELNFALFSTSGVHGTYNTIEESEQHLNNPENEDLFGEITFVIVHPRLCCLRYGNCNPQNIGDIEYLKSLRKSSYEVVQKIGKA
jgi:hypothetical protein